MNKTSGAVVIMEERDPCLLNESKTDVDFCTEPCLFDKLLFVSYRKRTIYWYNNNLEL